MVESAINAKLDTGISLIARNVNVTDTLKLAIQKPVNVSNVKIIPLEEIVTVVSNLTMEIHRSEVILAVDHVNAQTQSLRVIHSLLNVL